ncbi:aldo/keto reductase [Oleiagrimonas soli]|uniref:Alcohol dehydrogenase n=1 Tax=Oleiagrimonas soli TaxID=1543381 RepID=A0A099CTZ3_9GAMM|nr:aldo/keto reductase [Oleiagrimonas soli]KGI77264.1 alcohol dehydrogenase [Oleiagrimonas soli]MBB6185541.1 aryl-alcohol dehydrogenase-like predicted oxidoreductase [Oleiagrimonas soli]
MELRRLGRSALEIAPLALGGNVFGWTADEKASFAVLDAFVEAGFQLIDTADVYSQWVPGHVGGESETVIGKWLRRSGKRDRVLIATKVAKDSRRRGLSPDNIRLAVEESLQRLGIETIDLYQSHEFDPDVPQAETLGAYARLIEQGKVRFIGASNFTAAQMREALQVSAEHDLPRYECMQPEYNLMERVEYEDALQTLAVDERIGVISYFALASGFLSGKYRSSDDLGKSARGGSVQKYLNAHGLKVLRAMDDIAAHHDASTVQIALAWLMAKPGITAPIASATSTQQLQELVGAARLKLAAEEIERLDRVSARS